MLVPPPEPNVPQTRKRKREEQPEPQTDTQQAAPVESRSTTAPSEPVSAEPAPCGTQAYADSDGDGQEVESLLRTCSIAENERDTTVDEDKTAERSRSTTVADIESAELRYPASEEPMEVDPPSVTEQPSETGTSSRSGETTEDTATSEGHGAQHGAGTAQQPLNPLTWIYTFDSLGTRHPAVANRLGKYLQREAVDKKNHSLEETSIATYKYAKVPLQKNFCDCGLYVLYFVKTFMEDPEHAQQCIR
ncbi:Ulp1 protease family, C-terminal catalytic domain-containing protein [Trametes meyenii]|nr:Ulp1 protease family, C-terminal catalytic domain-containing protein [Trametes meyenii]